MRTHAYLWFLLLAVLPMNAQDQAVLGLTAYEQENYTEAVRHFQQAITQQPSVSNYVNLGHSLSQLEQWPAAIQAYQHALSLDSSAATATVYRSLGQACLRAQKYDRAIEALQQARTLEPRGGDGLWLAQALMAKQQWVSAQAILWRELDRVPGQEEALGLLAEVQGRQRDWEHTAVIYGELVTLAPENSTYRLGYARAQAQSGNYHEAHDTLDIALRLDPECQIQVQRLLADLQLVQELPREATLFYMRLLLRMDSPTPEDLYRLGVAYLQSKELASAEQCFTRLKHMDANDVRAPQSLGQITALQGELAAARAHYEAALVLAPASASNYLALATLADRQLDPARAAQYYDRALELGAISQDVFDRAITAAREAQQMQLALTLLKRGLLYFPQSQRLLDQLDRWAGTD